MSMKMSSIIGRTLHVTCRNNVYPRSNVKRFPVPDDCVPWSVTLSGYDPPSYTAVHINGQVWADPEMTHSQFKPKWNHLDDNINRVSYNGEYQINENGYPLNPMGRTGLRGRGLLGRWGPNHAADPIVTRWKRDSQGNTIKDSDSMKFVTMHSLYNWNF